MFITWGYGRAMNYRQIEIFKAIMDRGSITEAARVLGISQPAVSKGLQLLEGELGLQLFTRTTKGIAATDEARALYRWFTPLMHLDVHVKFVQYIKLAIAECGLGTETVRPPRLPLAGAEREQIIEIIRKGIATRPTIPARLAT